MPPLYPNHGWFDVFKPMLDAEENVRGELFVEDRLHLNREGYQLWKEVVGSYLEEI